MAEDAETAGEQLLALAVALGPLGREEAHHGLGHGQSDGLLGHRLRHAPPETGSLGSTAWEVQVSRTQACAGSSQISQARSGPGPAMTLR